MEKFTTLSATAAPLPMANVDTDMIIPKQFLRTIKRTGLSEGLFYDMRFDEQGKPKDGFVLDRPAYKGAQTRVTGENFGFGSARGLAPRALQGPGEVTRPRANFQHPPARRANGVTHEAERVLGQDVDGSHVRDPPLSEFIRGSR